jgi:hypothetical protein
MRSKKRCFKDVYSVYLINFVKIDECLMAIIVKI